MIKMTFQPKRLTAVLAALAAISTLSTACTGQTEPVPDAETTTSVPTGEVTTAPQTDDTQTGQLPQYTIIEDTTVLAEFGADSVVKTLRYPAFEENSAQFAAINRTLAKAAEREYQSHALNVQMMIDEKQPYHYEVTKAEVLRCDEAIISVLCQAEYTTTGTDIQVFTYTCNINPADGSEYAVRDLITDYDRLGTLLREGKGTQVWGAENLLSQTTWDDLLVQIKTNYEIFPAACFDSEGVVISFELLELLGWNAGFRITYADAGDALKLAPPTP